VATQTRALAVGLRNLGVEPGDRVAIVLPNWPEFVVAVLAASELGATIVPLNPGYAPRELQYMLRNSEASVAITAEDYGGVDYLQLFETLLIDLPDLQYLVTVGEEDLWYDDRIFQFEDVVATGRGREFAPVRIESGDEPFAILYTPGTMGTPKGVVLSHDNLVRTATATAGKLGLHQEVVLCCVPLYHIFGLSAVMLTAIASGSALVLQGRFNAAAAFDLVERHGATIFHGVPTMFVMALRELDAQPRSLPTLRGGIIAGAPVLEELVRDVRKRLVPELEIAYGLTETSPTVSITQPSDPPAKRFQTVGTPLDGVEVEIRDEDGKSLPAESVGELAIRGFNVMKGYFRQPTQTSAVLAEDGFLRTGDLAMIDAEGYLHIVGRSSDVIIRGGYNVYPQEIEVLLRSHPAVADAAVLGIPNDVLGELVCACVLPVEGALITAEELRGYVYESLADYKVPDLFQFMEEFPDNTDERARRVELARVVRVEEASGSGEPV
jgi:fatty-acyl-CoA synthase